MAGAADRVHPPLPAERSGAVAGFSRRPHPTACAGCRSAPSGGHHRRGALVLRLWLASDAPDADIAVKLVDLHPANEDYPDGFAMNLTEGLLRLRYRDSWERPALMTLGETYLVSIPLFPIANLFKRGHQLRLDITGSNFPPFDVNPNSGEPEGSFERPRRATTRVFAGSTPPSQVILPVLPAGGRSAPQLRLFVESPLSHHLCATRA